MTSYIQKNFKTILNVRKHVDSWFWERYGINPYNGCQFNCVYCDSRSKRYYLPESFEAEITVKNNIGPMLDKRISNARTLLPDITGLGGTTDPYQPAEKKFENTKQCLEVLLKHNYPVHVITKSTLALRDIELLRQIAINSCCIVSLTITSTDEKTASFSEPGAPSPQERFNVIKTLKESSPEIQTGVLLMPVLPGLSDSADQIEKMIVASKEAGADYVLFGGALTMRDNQADWFLSHLESEYPHLIEKYEKLYRFKHKSGSYSGGYGASVDYNHKLVMQFFSFCKKHKMRYRIKRFIPADYRKYNYLIAEKFLNRSYFLQMTGKPYKNAFWAGMNIQNLTESIADIANRNELLLIKNIDAKMAEYITRFVNERIEEDKPKSKGIDPLSPTLF